MTAIPVVGMDPSLRNWGIAHGFYYPEGKRLQLHEVAVIQPEIPEGKQVRKNTKDIERARQLAFKAALAARRAQAVFVEVPVGSQSARAMASYGICVGVLGGLYAQDMPCHEITPTQVKLAVTGSKTASKADIIEAMVARYPHLNWPYQNKKGVRSLVMGKAEHMADAIGAIEAGVHSTSFQQLVKLLHRNTSTMRIDNASTSQAS